MKKKKNVDLGEKAIATAHCVGPPPKDMSGKPRPVLVKFETYKDRCQVWEQKAKLKGSAIYIAEDDPAEVELKRKKLYPIMIAANAYRDEAGYTCRPYQAHLNTDKLIFNSRAYTADNLSAHKAREHCYQKHTGLCLLLVCRFTIFKPLALHFYCWA